MAYRQAASLGTNTSFTPSACRDFSGMDTLTASRVLRRLRDRGFLEKHGAGNRTNYEQRYPASNKHPHQAYITAK